MNTLAEILKWWFIGLGMLVTFGIIVLWWAVMHSEEDDDGNDN